jgi:hypothetical protein
MKTLTTRRAPIQAAVLFATVIGARAASNSEAPSRAVPIQPTGISHESVLWDAPGDGSIWARGANYKASFAARGATYYPAFGARAPANAPHSFSPDVVTIGGQRLAFESAATAERDSDRITFDRGAFVEIYDLSPTSMEQSFVFDTIPGSGDLVLHIPVDSPLEARDAGSALEFRGDFGSVTYGRAIAFDAGGRRIDAATTLDGSSITIRVDAAFLAGVALPLVIDPTVGTIQIPGTSDDDYSADVSFDDSTQVWFVVWEQRFSAADTDAYCQTFDYSGASLATATIDFTGDRWESPRCANNAAADQFLVVAGVTSGVTKSIKGRRATPNGPLLSLGSQFTISNADAGDKSAPDVAGDTFNGPLTEYCVAYTRVNPGGYTEIGVTTVRNDMVVLGTYYIPGAGGIFGADDTQPSIAKATVGNYWLLAWRRRVNIENGDIWAAYLDYNGVLALGPTAVTPGTILAESNPCASSPTPGIAHAVIAYQGAMQGSSNRDIYVASMIGASVQQTVNLTTLEGTGLNARDQIEPSVDCDGRHFVVAYSEYNPTFLHYDVYASDVYLADSTIGLRQSHVLVQGFGLSERRSNVAATHHLGGWDNTHAIVYDFEQNSTDHDVFGNRFATQTGGTFAATCFGDGSGTACPCGNFGAAGRGCASSVSASGALLDVASGTPSTIVDDVVLRASGLPATATCLFFQGTTILAGSVFGDGLQCTGGTVVRLATKTASSGVALYPNGGPDASISTRGLLTTDGGRRGYQVWYRNAATFCTASTFNLTNGLRIDWAR